MLLGSAYLTAVTSPGEVSINRNMASTFCSAKKKRCKSGEVSQTHDKDRVCTVHDHLQNNSQHIISKYGNGTIHAFHAKFKADNQAVHFGLVHMIVPTEAFQSHASLPHDGLKHYQPALVPATMP